MKKILLPLASFALVIPAYALDGEGTKDNPFKITKIEDFAEMETAPVGSYYILENDIDATGGKYATPFQKTPGEIYLDGNYHIIKGLDSAMPNAGLFGLIDGEIKNLGIENAKVVDTGGGWGPAGIIAAYAGCNASMIIDNCYTTGSVNGYYSGGLVGGTKVGITITNCYSAADCTSGNGFAGGLLGCVNYAEGKTITANISNSYASGEINGKVMAGGLVGGNQQHQHPATGSEVVNFNNVVAWNPTVSGGAAGMLMGVGAVAAEINEESGFYWEFLLLNNEDVENGKSREELEELVKTWQAFTVAEDYDMPVLKWQVERPSSTIAEIAAEENAPAEYFNLQGVRVANPDNGIYIVRRGAKVTKEVIR
ncbi:MAG: hypothetical protein K2I89_02795 [Muribaculaceae bacterium]|nr:hypothetical protein [Muribaculaceae bacterium]